MVVDADSIKHEQNLGSDVSQSQQIDPDVSNNNEQENDDSVVPMRTTYVTATAESYLTNKNAINSAIVDSACDMFLEEDKDDNLNQNEMVEGNDVDIFLTDLFGNNDTSNIINSHRSKNPANEFESNDKILVGAFLCVFSLGVAYKRSSGSLTYEERNHLLKQFSMVPSRCRRLMGYLDDVMKRHSVILGSKLHISGKESAIDGIHKFLD